MLYGQSFEAFPVQEPSTCMRELWWTSSFVQEWCTAQFPWELEQLLEQLGLPLSCASHYQPG